MNKLALSCLAAALALTAAVHTARATFTFTLTQVGTNVMVNGSGSFNLAGLTFNGTVGAYDGIYCPNANLGAGTPTQGYNYTGLSGPSNFGTALLSGNGSATSSTGAFVFLAGSLGQLGLPTGYVSNSVITNSDTFANATFASLGFRPGTYTYTYGTGANADTLVITGVAPEPSTWAMLGLGVVGAGVVALRRRSARTA